MRASPVDKDTLADEMAPLRAVFTRSIVARVDLPAGTLLREEHLALKKPGTGIPAARIDEVVGRTAARDLPQDTVLTEDLLA